MGLTANRETVLAVCRQLVDEAEARAALAEEYREDGGILGIVERGEADTLRKVLAIIEAIPGPRLAAVPARKAEP